VYDHTSIVKLVEWRWGLRPLSVRDRDANNLAGALDFSHRNLAAPAITAPRVISGPPC
jgi:phospholipase C